MDTHIIHSRFWTDGFISRLSTEEKLFFLYLLTNDNVTIAGVYELPQTYIVAATGFTEQQISQFKKKFSDAKKFVFYDDWIRVVNFERYRKYTGSVNEKAKKRLIKAAPSQLFEAPP